MKNPSLREFRVGVEETVRCNQSDVRCFGVAGQQFPQQPGHRGFSDRNAPGHSDDERCMWLGDAEELCRIRVRLACRLRVARQQVCQRDINTVDLVEIERIAQSANSLNFRL